MPTSENSHLPVEFSGSISEAVPFYPFSVARENHPVKHHRMAVGKEFVNSASSDFLKYYLIMES